MRAFAGTVENGSVRLPTRARVRDGTRVIVTVLRAQRPRKKAPPYPPELDAEDAKFVLACRGRLAKILRDEEA